MAAAAASLSSRSKLRLHHLSLSTFSRFFSSPPPPSTSLPSSSSSSSYVHLHRFGSGAAKNSINAAALPPLPAKQNKMRTCACSPSTHPGSFRCSLHKFSTMMSRDINNPKKAPCKGTSSKGYDLRKSTMTKWAMRFGGVDEEMVETLLSAPSRPCHQRLRRRRPPNFRLQPSQLSVMSMA